MLSQTILDSISLTSSLGKSLKTTSVRKINLNIVLKDVIKYIDMGITEQNLIHLKYEYRFKSFSSIRLKYDKYLKIGTSAYICFNDLLGIRIIVENYPKTFPNYFRLVDLRKGKSNDDGYRAIHLYYQRDSYSYPIEIQIWNNKDQKFNIWSHKYIYKLSDNKIGTLLRLMYDNNEIRTELEFKEKYQNLLGGRGH